MVKSRVAIVLCLVLFFSLAGKVPAGETLKLGIHPYISASALHDKFTPLADYLTQKLGQKVVIQIAQSYDKHVDDIGQNRVDLAYVGPAPYIELVNRYGRKPILAGLEVRGTRTFHGVIITRADCPCTSLQDLIGRKFAFGNVNSTMSHLIPRYMLLEAGVGVDQLAGHEFLANHDNVALGVLMGDFDAGAVKEETFNKYKERGLRALVLTPEIAAHLFVASDRLPAPLVARAQQAMYALAKDEAGRQILKAIKKDATGLVPAADQEYDNHRRISNTLSAQGIIP